MTLAGLVRRYCTPRRRRRIHAGACMVTWAAYLVLFAPLYRAAGPGVAALAALPVLLTASLYGIVPGIAAALLADVATLLLLTSVGLDGAPSRALVQWACPAVALLVVAAGVGRLRTLRNRLASQIEERRNVEAALERSERMFRSVVEQSVDGIVLIDDQARVTIWNAAEERITGISRSEALGQHLADLQLSLATEEQRTPEARARLQEVFQRFISTGEAPWLSKPMEREFRSRDGKKHTVQSIIYPFSIDGRRMYGSINRDVTEQRRAERIIEASLREKDVLLREIHHRVKNNLQIIASLLELQGDNISDPHALTQLAEGQQRIQTMALVHENLYRSADLAYVNLAEYVADLAEQLCATRGVQSERIEVTVDVADVRLGVDTAIPCGLLINELVSNSLKHAFPGGRAGRVRVTMRHDHEHITLEVSDDGVGLPPGLDHRATSTLGLQLVNLLTEQLRGQLSLLAGPGTTFRITFPLPANRGAAVGAEGRRLATPAPSMGATSTADRTADGPYGWDAQSASEALP